MRGSGHARLSAKYGPPHTFRFLLYCLKRIGQTSLAVAVSAMPGQHARSVAYRMWDLGFAVGQLEGLPTLRRRAGVWPAPADTRTAVITRATWLTQKPSDSPTDDMRIPQLPQPWCRRRPQRTLRHTTALPGKFASRSRSSSPPVGKRSARRRGLADVFMALRKAALVLRTPAGRRFTWRRGAGEKARKLGVVPGRHFLCFGKANLRAGDRRGCRQARSGPNAIFGSLQPPG